MQEQRSTAIYSYHKHRVVARRGVFATTYHTHTHHTLITTSPLLRSRLCYRRDGQCQGAQASTHAQYQRWGVCLRFVVVSAWYIYCLCVASTLRCMSCLWTMCTHKEKGSRTTMSSELQDPLGIELEPEYEPPLPEHPEEDDPLGINLSEAPIPPAPNEPAAATAISPDAGSDPTAPPPLLRHPSTVITPPQPGAPTMGKQVGTCVHCGVPMRNLLGTMCEEGPLHNECVPEYRRQHIERCAHCNNVLRQARVFVGDKKVHPECVDAFKLGKAYVPPRKCGMFRKFSIGRSRFGRRNWQDRYGVLCSSHGGLAYFESEAHAMAYEGGSRARLPNGSVLLAQGSPGCRIISKPTFRHHPKATNASRELILVFLESGKEYMLLMQFQSWEERCDWLRVMETYVYSVDDPSDYKDP